jgi:hypothetical protein
MTNLSIIEFETAATAGGAMTSQPGGGLTALTFKGSPVTINSQSGAVAEAYVDATGNIIIAYQGTQTTAQLEADLLMSANVQPESISALSQALSFVSTVKTAALAAGLNPQNISVTGYSLGGNLAEYVASQTGLPGISFAGSGLPHYVAPATPAKNFISFVETGDPWANRASDAALAPIVSDQDHYGTVELIGNPADTALTSAIVSGVQGLIPAMLRGSGAQAMAAVINDWDTAFMARHVNNSYYADVNALPQQSITPGSSLVAAAQSTTLIPALSAIIGATKAEQVVPTSVPPAAISGLTEVFSNISKIVPNLITHR